MTQEKFKPRLHAPNATHPTWAICGRFSSGIEITTDLELVTCGHCMRRLGHDPRKKLADAVAALVLAYDKGGNVERHIAPLVVAWHAEQDYISTRRYYR